MQQQKEIDAMTIYDNTKDIILLMRLLGHKRIQTTFAYLDRHKR